MSDLHYKRTKKKSSGKGFYVALGICLIAVGVAAWTTYDNVVQYTEVPEDYQETSSAIQTENSVSGVKMESEDESSKDETSSKTEGTTHDVDLVVSAAPSSSEPEDETEEGNLASEEEAGLVFNVPEEQTFVFPAGNTILKPYSGDELVYSETMKDWRVHNGIDLAANIGDTVHSVGNGTVKEIYTDEMYGNVIVISYGNVDVYYCGLGSTALVEAGENVIAGQDIGSVNTIPCESIEAPHLHLEMKKDGILIDPSTLLP